MGVDGCGWVLMGHHETNPTCETLRGATSMPPDFLPSSGKCTCYVIIRCDIMDMLCRDLKGASDMHQHTSGPHRSDGWVFLFPRLTHPAFGVGTAGDHEGRSCLLKCRQHVHVQS